MIDSQLNKLYQLAAAGKSGSNVLLDRTIDQFLAAKAKNATTEVLSRILQKGIQQIAQKRAIEKRVMRF